MNKQIRRPNTLQEQLKIKKFDPIELKAWNSIYPDITFKEKKICSKKIFDGDVCKDTPKKEKPKKKIDIEKVQKAKVFKKIKKKNPKVFMNKN